MESRHRTRLLIADDHNLVAEACKSFLEPEFEVVGIVNDGRALLQAALELKPDILILDITMPLLNGLDAGEQLKSSLPSLKLVYLTMNMSPEVAAEAFRRGASAYLPKSTAAKELLTAIRDVRRGTSYLSPLITKETVQFLLRSGRVLDSEKRLTPRQREVLQLIAEGMSMKEVAYTLHLKPGTVAFHKYRIMSILGVRTNAELLQYAIKQHMIPS
jgi:DNA-binding NarL/FixJ family response regulator